MKQLATHRGHGVLHAVAALALLLLVAGFGMPQFSGASYVSSSRSMATVSAARDWTAPTVTLRAPGETVQGVVSLVADAADGVSGVRDVVVQYAAPSGGWVPVCTATTSPYTCAWDTRVIADGTYTLRAVATDVDGNSTTSSTVSTTVANNLVVALASPGDAVRGAVPLTATLSGAGTTSYSVKIQYAPAGTTTWNTICTTSAAPYVCSWNTGLVANQYYDLRAVATAGSTSTPSATVADVLVDNAAPSVTMQDPGSPLRGVVTFAASATDQLSGIAKVSYQYAVSGAGTFTDLCTGTTDPWSCSYDTTKLKDGSYTFRAIAVDVAGNSATSASTSSRTVDNTVSSVSLNDPGPYLNGTVALTANASSTAGVSSVKIQRTPAGGTTWTDVCTDTTAPYSCGWDTTAVSDALYDLRAVLVDGAGKTTVSAVVSSRRVDNNPVRGLDVQTANGGAGAGKVDAGDRITFLYSEQLNLSSITSGWSGSPLAVTLRLRDGNLLSLGNKGDTVDVLLNGAVVNVGSVSLKEDYIKSNQTALFSASLTASTTTVNGAPATLLTVTVNGVASGGGGLRAVSTASTMVWTPSAAATDLGNRNASSTPVAETGAADREF